MLSHLFASIIIASTSSCPNLPKISATQQIAPIGPAVVQSNTVYEPTRVYNAALGNNCDSDYAIEYVIPYKPKRIFFISDAIGYPLDLGFRLLYARVEALPGGTYSRVTVVVGASGADKAGLDAIDLRRLKISAIR